MIKVGKVVAIDEKSCKVRVQLLDTDGVVTYWLPVVVNKSQQDKFYWLPDIDEEVICCFLENGIEQGFVLGAVYNSQDSPPVANKDKFHIRFSDGSFVEYDRVSHKLKVDVKGDALISVSGKCSIDCDGQVQITSAANIVMQAQGGISMAGAGGGNFSGNMKIVGNLEIEGNVHATGSIIDDGGNTNHHTH